MKWNVHFINGKAAVNGRDGFRPSAKGGFPARAASGTGVPRRFPQG